VALWAEEQSIQPLALQPELIREYLGVLLQEGLNARSQARFISALRSFYKFLLLEELLTVDPTELIDSPQIGRALPDVLSEDDINAIIKAIDLSKPQGERNRAMLEMLYGCGLRVSELVNVQLSNLRFIDGYIIVTGKGNKQRIVPINRAAIKFVTLYREQVRIHQTPVRGSEDILFLNRRGKKLTRVMVFTIIKNLAVKAGITKHVSPHTFRHSFATHMVNRGANLRVVQEMLGHESITTTEIYTHLNETKLRDTITKFHPRA
jgi:integrase/recombinase XerD